MKRFALTILMLLLSATLFGQNLVEDINGFDWITWLPAQKTGYVQGWMSAYSSIISLLAYSAGDEIDEATEEIINNHLYISMNVGQIVNKIDNVYASYDNRQYKLLQVFMIIAGKDFWNQSGEKQESEGESQIGSSI